MPCRTGRRSGSTQILLGTGDSLKRAAFFSGGKDATLAIIESSKRGRPVDGLITTYGEQSRRLAVQGLRLEIIQAQADRLGLPLVAVALPEACTNQAYLRNIRAAMNHLPDLQALVFGDIHLQDIRRFREKIFQSMDYRLEFPLWDQDSRTVSEAILDAGIQADVCTVDPDRGDPAWLGARYSRAWLKDLPGSVDRCGEQGEFHTVVTDAPNFTAPLDLKCGKPFRQAGQCSLDYCMT